MGYARQPGLKKLQLLGPEINSAGPHLFSGDCIPILLPATLHALMAYFHECIIKAYWHESHRELM